MSILPKVQVRRQFPLSFEVGHSDALDALPDRYVPAVVPGAVQLDWARAEGWPPHWVANNFEQYGWMEDKHWQYRTKLPHVDRSSDQRVYFVSHGIDYHFQVVVDGKLVLDQEGMFSKVQLDVTDYAPGTELSIRIRPVPKYAGAHRPKAQAARSVKPSVSYGWDFHPRLIPLGIWDETYLELRNETSIESTNVQTQLDAQAGVASLRCNVVASGNYDGAIVVWELSDPDGKLVSSLRVPLKNGTACIQATLQNPRLWWCNGQGKPELYTSTVRLLDSSERSVDTRQSRLGIRRVRLVMNEGAWLEPSQFPKSRSTPPMTIELNGRRIFAKGSNWVCPDIFAGTLGREDYDALLLQAQTAHFNILRCWGGATINKESFYDLCDELGIMVWQEFPLACNTYEDDQRYLEVLNSESRSIVKKLREHACLAMWCGGNELFNWWSAMTDQHLALRLLNANCLELDPQTPYLPTSPVMGVGHGDYRFRDDQGKEVFQMFANASNTAYTEFGVPGPASVSLLESFIPKDELFPPQKGTSWETHHAFGAWFVAPESWLFAGLIEEYFGRCRSLQELVQRGQLLQSEGYKCLFEEARRQKPYASMALNWCYNEPWPTAANNSLVSWPAQAKPALQAVAGSCRPTLLSAKIPKFRWEPGELFSVDVSVLHDAPVPFPKHTVTVFLAQEGQPELAIGQWDAPETTANTNVNGPKISATLPPTLEGTFRLILRSNHRGDEDLCSQYHLCGPVPSRS
jgi:beta-mannosidase